MNHWNAVILSGDRAHNDPVASVAGVSCKAEAKIAGVMLLERILDALSRSASVNKIVSVGPDPKILKNRVVVDKLLKKYNAQTISPAIGPSESALRGVQKFSSYPTLVITCDLPLLDSTIIDHYCRQVENIDADFVIGAVHFENIENLLPHISKTTYTLDRQPTCFANLFSVLTPSGLNAINFWRSIENSRKKPLEVVNRVGWTSVLRYKFGWLSTEGAAAKLSDKTGSRIKIEHFSQAEIALDVDSARDYEILGDYIKKR